VAGSREDDHLLDGGELQQSGLDRPEDARVSPDAGEAVGRQNLTVAVPCWGVVPFMFSANVKSGPLTELGPPQLGGPVKMPFSSA
jgi:hypothetical protein